MKLFASTAFLPVHFLALPYLSVRLLTILSTLFFDKTDDSNTPHTQEEIEDLGYAVVVDDDGNEILPESEDIFNVAGIRFFYEPNEILKINSIISKVLWEETTTLKQPTCFRTNFFHNKNPKKFQIIVQRNFNEYEQMVTLFSIKYFDSINNEKEVSGDCQKKSEIDF